MCESSAGSGLQIPEIPEENEEEATDTELDLGLCATLLEGLNDIVS
jgi:hypothetical protein